MIFNYIENKTEELLKTNKLFTAPIKVTKLAKKLGVKVEAKDFDEDVSGLFVIKKNKPFIAYNANQENSRKRFTIAHELGHYILHSKDKPLFIDKPKEIMLRKNDSYKGEFIKEREANAFAAAILMPKNLLLREIESNNSPELIETLAKKFKVNTQAMSFRLSNLGYEFGLF